ncbi:MAG TPA: nuclear transport factor 2 family protein [Caulobacteraceae bacterium]|nr:nuclear transport factor 2 family protein [Caulobacteraceae bacterium]
MKRLPWGLLLVLAACGEQRVAPVEPPTPAAPARAAPTPAVTAAPMRSDEAELVRLEHAYAKALIQKDREFLMSFYASNWRGGNWTGFWTKSRMIRSLLDDRYVVKSMEVRDLKVRVIGDVAIVQGIDDEVTSMNGRDTSGRWVFTDVFEKRDGRWVAVASHTSEMKGEPN